MADSTEEEEGSKSRGREAAFGFMTLYPQTSPRCFRHTNSTAGIDLVTAGHISAVSRPIIDQLDAV